MTVLETALVDTEAGITSCESDGAGRSMLRPYEGL